jgi:16S rRNA (guanine1516-N2)-methyltransferase
MLKLANQTLYHKAQARQLVEQLSGYSTDKDFVLTINDEEIILCSSIHQQKTCYSHSFVNTRLITRARQKNQALLKACNNKKKQLLRVLDLTAGWGRDSFILASHGQHIILVESHPLLAACIEYLLQIAAKDSGDEIFQRMSIRHRNSYDFLKQQTLSTADCIYLDPMFPAHKSSARPTKDLQLLQLLTVNQNIPELFELALHQSAARVVVKRPLHAPVLNDRQPDIVYREKTIRFDVYLK